MTVKKEQTKLRSRRLASVSSIVEFRAKLQRTAGETLKVVSGRLGNDIGPLSNSGTTDPQSPSNVHRLFEVRDHITFEHDSMLTIVHAHAQPYLAGQSVTLVSMNWQDCKTLGDRLQWAMDKAKVTRANLASACGVSTVSVGKWVNNDSKNMKMENLFTAAELCLVNAKWLGTGQGTPSAGITAIYTDVSGPDLQIARDLSKLDDKNLRGVIRELIVARQTATADKSKKQGNRDEREKRPRSS